MGIINAEVIALVERKEYIDKLTQWKDEQVIKVITGIRRCGKSTLLAQYQSWLLKNGISEEQIVSVNFEELEYEDLLDYKKLYTYLKGRLIPGKTTYIFLDEIQKVPSFERNPPGITPSGVKPIFAYKAIARALLFTTALNCRIRKPSSFPFPMQCVTSASPIWQPLTSFLTA